MAWYFNGNYPWLGMLFCAPIIGLWYWCTDQYIVQRALGAPNEREARRGSIFAAFLKLLPVFIFIIPGMICFALAQSGRVPSLREALFTSDGELVTAKAQAAFPLMVQEVLPVGRPRHRRGRAAGGADEFAGRRLQRLLDAVHDGLLPQVPPAAPRSTSWSGSAGSPPP